MPLTTKQREMSSDESLSRQLAHIAKHVTAMTGHVKETCFEASTTILRLLEHNRRLKEALEAVDGEIALGGQIKELVDAALDDTLGNKSNPDASPP